MSWFADAPSTSTPADPALGDVRRFDGGQFWTRLESGVALVYIPHDSPVLGSELREDLTALGWQTPRMGEAGQDDGVYHAEGATYYVGSVAERWAS